VYEAHEPRGPWTPGAAREDIENDEGEKRIVAAQEEMEEVEGFDAVKPAEKIDKIKVKEGRRSADTQLLEEWFKRAAKPESDPDDVYTCGIPVGGKWDFTICGAQFRTQVDLWVHVAEVHESRSASPEEKNVRSADAKTKFEELELAGSDVSGGRRFRGGARFPTLATAIKFIEKIKKGTGRVIEKPNASMIEVCEQDVSGGSDVTEEANLTAEADARAEQGFIEEEMMPEDASDWCVLPGIADAELDTAQDCKEEKECLEDGSEQQSGGGARQSGGRSGPLLVMVVKVKKVKSDNSDKVK
jgi:hypothetical protein